MSPPASTTSSPLWAGLFPAGVVVVTQAELSESPSLLPEERSFVTRAVDKRVLEFTAGRSCARAALIRLGGPPVALSVGAHREPLWPQGFVGSITHCEGHCAAAVARQDRASITSLGLDAEPAQPLPEEIVHRVLTAGEQDWLLRRGRDSLPWDRLVFSAKESVFKCLFPVERRYIDFHEVEIAFVENGGFQLRAQGLLEAEKHVRGACAVRAGLILTAATWSASSLRGILT
jgi:4'-phosphopantetheinyl transferase EntD